MSDGQDGPELFAIEVDREDDAVVIAVHGELDIATAPVLEGALQDAAGTANRIILDLHRLRFMDASGLNVVLASRRLTSRVIVRSPSPQARWVMAITGADRWLALEPDG